MDNRQLITNYYTVHRDELLAFVDSRLGDFDTAEDLVQNVFLRLLTTDRMITSVTLPALVYTIARNLITDYYRHRTTIEEFEHVIRGSRENEDSLESVISARNLTEMMERGLARVPVHCREVYRLHIYGGMKVSEISRETGETYKSVENHLGTARRAVRKFMRKYA